MLGTMNKTSGVKLLALVFAMAMVAVGAAVVLSDDSVNAAPNEDTNFTSEIEDGTYEVSDNTVVTLTNTIDTTNTGTLRIERAAGTTQNVTLTINMTVGGPTSTDGTTVTDKIMFDDIDLTVGEGVTLVLNLDSTTQLASDASCHIMVDGNLTAVKGATVEFSQSATAPGTTFWHAASANGTMDISGSVIFNNSNGINAKVVMQNTGSITVSGISSDAASFSFEAGSMVKEGSTVNVNDADAFVSFIGDSTVNGNINSSEVRVYGGATVSVGANGKINADTIQYMNPAEGTQMGSIKITAGGSVTGTGEAATIEQALALLKTMDEVTLTSVSELELETDFIIDDGKTLNIVNTTINGVKADGSCFSFLVSGNLNINNSYVYAGVNVDVDTEDSIEGVLTVSGSHTLSATGVGNTNLYVGVGDTLNFTGTVPAQRTIYVFGNLVATDISVEGTVNSYVGSSVTLDGTANISGDFIMNDADIEIAGTVNVRNDTNGGADFTLNRKSNVTVLDTGVFNVNKPTAIAATGVNKLAIEADSTFTVEGTLNITGTLSGNVIDKGTVNFNGTSDKGSISLYNGVTLTVTSVSGKLVVNDSGAAKDVIGEKKYNNGADVSEGNVIELNNVRGVTISESTVKQTRYYYSNMEISGTFIVLDNNTADASVTIKATVDSAGAPGKQKCGEIVYSGTSVIGAGVAVINQGELTVTGDISVTRSTATGTKSGIINNTDGEITVEGSIVMYDAQLAGIVNAMYYTVTGTEATANYYTGFAAAIAAAGDADSDTVYVQGNVTVSKTAEIAAATYVAVNSGATLTISKGVTVTVADTASLNVAGTVVVKGTLVITNTDTGLSYGTLKYDVYTVNGKTATYTNLANALANANPGDVITIAQDVTLGSSTTIPAEVTVQTSDNAIILKDNVTLTVEGTLAIQRNGELKANATASPALEWGTDVKLVVDGVVSDANATQNIGMKKYSASGAVFEIRSVYYLTSVEYAAGISAQVDKIDIYGSVSFDDVTFTEGDNNTLVVTFNNMKQEDDTFRGNVTLDGAKMNVAAGLFTGNVTAAADGADAVVALSGASNIEIESTVDVMTLGGIVGEGSSHLVLGNVTVQSGTVTATSMDLGKTKNGTFTVASGATLLVGKDSSVGVNNIAEIGLTVDGTIAIDEGSFAVAANGTAVINGTMSVENTTGSDVSIAGTMVVAGTLDISTAEDTAAVVAVSGTLLVGAVPETLGQTTSGSVSGEVDLNATSGMIIVYTGSSIENIDVGNAEFITTKYYINETEYATAYTFSGQKTIVNGLGSIELDAVDFDNVNTKWYSDDAMTKEIADKNNALMTSYENVYISAPISERTGTISAGTGLDLYIDNIRWDATLGYKLAVGTHTVSFDVKAGYDGSNATITFNGQTVENGGTIEITANGFVLVANGAVPSSGQVVVDGGSSDGMSLTDYLLIILVILIVIMAIMVAMRLMRS